LLLVDIDHFKRINDTLGHAAGDAALVTLSQMLAGSARQVDIVGRLGGEEFGVLLPRTDPMAALRTAERLRKTLAAAELRWRGEPLTLTVSVGVAIATDPDEAPAEVLERADRALYQAKREGRNRSVVAGIDRVDEPVDDDEDAVNEAADTDPGPVTQQLDPQDQPVARRRA
jgi:diguanylate cyclase (GGDEF)-like protein